MSASESSHLHDRSRTGTAGLIAVGVDGTHEGRDAAVLAAMIAAVTGAEVLLVAVHQGPLVALPQEMGWTGADKEAAEMLHELRDSVVPGAGAVIETDQSVARALERVARLEHRDLLVVGSTRRAPLGRVAIGSRARQLLGEAQCALAIAPRGLSARPSQELSLIAVGYDGGPEAHEALRLAASLARAANAKLVVRGVVDEQLGSVRWIPTDAPPPKVWDGLVESEVKSLREDADRAAAATGADTDVLVTRGSTADLLVKLSEDVDLLVIGSRRWGLPGRVLLGSTGESLLHDAGCATIVVPRVTCDGASPGH
jgi:nucleotide-binding universal stress UspA family protein